MQLPTGVPFVYPSGITTWDVSWVDLPSASDIVRDWSSPSRWRVAWQDFFLGVKTSIGVSFRWHLRRVLCIYMYWNKYINYYVISVSSTLWSDLLCNFTIFNWRVDRPIFFRMVLVMSAEDMASSIFQANPFSLIYPFPRKVGQQHIITEFVMFLYHNHQFWLRG